MLFEKIGLVDENFNYKGNMYVGVAGNLIVYISNEAPDDDMKEKFGECYDGKGKVIMPGFYNSHAHMAMTLMRGYGEGLSLDRWLNELIFPFEDKLNDEAVYWGTMLSVAESRRYGIVSTSDMYYFMDSIVRAVSTARAKVNISRGIANPMGVPVEKLDGLKEMHDSIVMYHGWDEGRVLVDTSVHAEYTTNEDTVRAVVEEAKKYQVGLHVHVSETASEVEGCRQRRDGRSPVEYLNDYGAFDTRCIAAHCVHIDDNDISILKEKDVTVATNPISNLKLVSGMCNTPKLFEAGVNVALGTDSVASNNSLDFFEEMKMMAMVGKMSSNNPAAMSPQQILYSATRAGAIAQGRKNSGLVKEGYSADLVVVNTDVPNMQPVHNMLNNLVYSGSGKDVVLTMVDGRVLYRDGEYDTIDIEKTIAEVNNAKNKIMMEL